MGTRLRTNGPAQGAVLLRVVTVRAEARVRVAVRAAVIGAYGEGARWRGGVRLRGMVDVGCVELC